MKEFKQKKTDNQEAIGTKISSFGEKLNSTRLKCHQLNLMTLNDHRITAFLSKLKYLL
jgi:hypothetical protein